MQKIDITQMPDCDIDRACAILSDCIKAALADPDKRRDFEAWKTAREASKHENRRV